MCAGVVDFPMLDRQLVLTENAITRMTTDQRLIASLETDWAVRDAALIHSRGNCPYGLSCVVCHEGFLSLEGLFPKSGDHR